MQHTEEGPLWIARMGQTITPRLEKLGLFPWPVKRSISVSCLKSKPILNCVDQVAGLLPTAAGVAPAAVVVVAVPVPPLEPPRPPRLRPLKPPRPRVGPLGGALATFSFLSKT